MKSRSTYVNLALLCFALLAAGCGSKSSDYTVSANEADSFLASNPRGLEVDYTEAEANDLRTYFVGTASRAGQSLRFCLVPAKSGSRAPTPGPCEAFEAQAGCAEMLVMYNYPPASEDRAAAKDRLSIEFDLESVFQLKAPDAHCDG
ncbi:MAG: hypothetical protein JHC98_03205 [Thermoleophilaceae bacterium]|nr:hypothetical protein [Thermoleophilaceae bacterium]